MTDITAAGALWQAVRHEVKLRADFEPIMSTFFHGTVLNHDTFEGALSFLLASKLDSTVLSSMAIREIFDEAYQKDPTIIRAAETDIMAVYSRDPACNSYSTPLLFYKGFHALQSHRVAHWLWNQERHSLAFYLQNQMSAAFGVDIHPAAQIGSGIMLDHATGVVIGVTCVIEDDVTMLQSVTLGGTGNDEATGVDFFLFILCCCGCVEKVSKLCLFLLNGLYSFFKTLNVITWYIKNLFFVERKINQGPTLRICQGLWSPYH